VTTDIIHLHDLKLHFYRGNFAQVGGALGGACRGLVGVWLWFWFWSVLVL